MTDLSLLTPSQALREPFTSMARECSACGDHRYALALESFDAYLERVRRAEALAQPPGRVPGIERWLGLHEEIVGCIRLRFGLTAELETEGGQIGYDIRPSARRRGFGTAALRLVLPEARRRGLRRLLLTADADNVASLKIIERNGGVLSGEARSTKSGKVIRRYWIDVGA